MSNTVIQTVEDPMRCELSRKPNPKPKSQTGGAGSDCILKRFSQWLWPAWMMAGPETRDSLTDSTNRATKKTSTFISTSTSSSPTSASASDTKWGSTCDRQKPRCSHCLDQQILCFYVAPPVRRSTTMKRAAVSAATKARAAHVEVVNSNSTSRGLLAN
ncbi:hypothetical protein BO70DRAFT_364314 [Aspergillus heteromorphus CBS 117.55]|uniref:Zn(2)-C6 fungal-type domain-containing protein n=1 Tax=Aspergillus heteromorphus CBS 117.55 TaxID=1448321 RepID=A0A317VL89_9EURO|nr:uncharacterized protein BO70DRAFT_364314 [Aspergillus heteromorphus CBS 117.55]PWY74339.1 hypothetical protein BO70DRAFT_364314 [Aspergillus heteromorphus CBS 117.55]